MKRTSVILLFIFPFLSLQAQVSFKTIVPQTGIVAGESFQVQYIVRGAEKINSFRNPLFPGFRFVSGPHLYSGSFSAINENQPLKNFVFTLEAVKSGRYIIPGAVAIINGKRFMSEDVFIEVISKEAATGRYKGERVTDNSDYLLRAGEDPYKKIKENLFLKLLVDKRSCYAGEPVLATFKLYSRLQSKSDIAKNPGFYGFTVHDMVNLSDKEMATEKINEKFFDVHTIRKVQLFPLQAGRYTIDAMEVENKVEFSRSVVNKKTEQEVVEGVLGNEVNNPKNENAEVFETRISTESVIIDVKPVPVANKPAVFNGAVGEFNISSAITQSKIAKNEEGVVNVIISGKGNFTQINAPVIEWPAGMEGFEPTIKDSLDKTKLPLTGSRTFRYTFICSKEGKYQLSPLQFCYFHPGSNSYRTLSSSFIQVEIGKEPAYRTGREKTNLPTETKKESIAEKNATASRVAAVIVFSIVLVVLVYWIRHKKEPVADVREEKTALPLVDELLAPVYLLITASSHEFYSSLYECTWNFFSIHFHISGSGMNKENLLVIMHDRKVNRDLSQEINSILQQCEAGIFTNAEMGENKEALLRQTKNVLEKISSQLL